MILQNRKMKFLLVRFYKPPHKSLLPLWTCIAIEGLDDSKTADLLGQHSWKNLDRFRQTLATLLGEKVKFRRRLEVI
jgi:hypothetical protein